MNPLFHYLHDQVKGFSKAGTDVPDAESSIDRKASKAFAMALGLAGLALMAVPLVLDFLPPRVAVKSLVVSMMVFGLAVKYWRGSSLFHLMGDLVRNWIPFSLLIYMYFTGGKMAIAVFKGGESVEYAIHGGFMMMAGSFLAIVTSLVHAYKLGEKAKAEGTTARAAVIGFRFYAIIWCAFFVGGFIMLAWGIGLADWFMVDVLGL
ncbi:MAG: hypothetical protein COA70_01130 [Planctomycetota bacterium]|nr:MAG: hypothetical protein COA70_01130 [Planctomycetota bacterium]